MRVYTPPISERRKVVVGLLDRGEPGRLLLARSFVQPAQQMYETGGEQAVYEGLKQYTALVPIERREELLQALQIVQVFPSDADPNDPMSPGLYFPVVCDEEGTHRFEPNWDRIEAITRTAPEAEPDYDLRLTEAELTEISTGSVPESAREKALGVLTEIASEDESQVH